MTPDRKTLPEHTGSAPSACNVQFDASNTLFQANVYPHEDKEIVLWRFISGSCWGKLGFPAPPQLKVSFKQCLIRSPWRWLLLPLLVMVLWGGQLAFFSPEVRNRFSRPGNVVLLGIDPIGANADVVLAVRLQDEPMRITQIPRDTFTHSEALGSWKIGELYGLAGAEAIQEQVTALVDADFPYLAVVHGGVVAALVDALGGLTVTVPQRMVYSDRSQGLFIDLQPGRQRLDGQQVEHFIRWRGFYGDIGRLERRQEVINALENAFQKPTIWARLPLLKQVLEDEARAGRLATNLDLQALPAIARGFTSRGVTIETLPGREGSYRGLSYWFAEQGTLPHGLTSPPQEDTFPPEAAPSPQQDPLPLNIPPPPSIPLLMEQNDNPTGEP